MATDRERGPTVASVRPLPPIAPQKAEEQTDADEAQAFLARNEADITRDFLQFAETTSTEETYVDIVRKRTGIKLSFRVLPVSAEKLADLRKQATIYKTIKNMGVKVAEDFDQPSFHALLIYEATHPDDRRRFWDNRQLWQSKHVVTGSEAIKATLRPGEIQKVIETIDAVNGFSSEGDDTVAREETSGN